MEDELFEFVSVDGDAEELHYFDVKLKQQIGEFPAGTHFSAATILFEKSWLTLYKTEGGEMSGRYILKLQVTKDLLNSDD